MKNDFNEIYDLFKDIHFLSMKRTFPKLQEIGLYPGQELVLKGIVEHPGIRQTELADFTQREAATTTKSVQRLLNSGHIMRKQDVNDRRNFRLFPTKLGEDAYNKMVSFRQSEIEYLKSMMSDEDIQKLSEIMKDIRDRMKGEK